jgi:hypothetical protein
MTLPHQRRSIERRNHQFAKCAGCAMPLRRFHRSNGAFSAIALLTERDGASPE